MPIFETFSVLADKIVMNTELIRQFIEQLGTSLSESNDQEFLKLHESLQIPEFNSPDSFYYNILYPWNQFAESILRRELSNNHELRFIFMHSTYLENHFEKLFERYEGVASCADKARTVIARLARFYHLGTPIEFDMNAKYTYHFPKRILTTQAEIIEFYQALSSLYYGNPVKYLTAIQSLIAATRNE